MKLAIVAFLVTSTFLFADPVKPEFHYTIFIAKPAQDVWDALTEKQIIDRYYMAPLHTLELKKGGMISYGGKSEIITGKIIEFDAPKKLVHSFHFAGSTDPESIVTYDIKPVGSSMCSLSITHTGFPSSNQTFADISDGWPVIASSLKTILETDHSLPWPKQ